MKSGSNPIKYLLSVLFLVSCLVPTRSLAKDLNVETYIINSAGEILDQSQEILEGISERFEDLDERRPSLDYEQQVRQWESRSPFIINGLTIEEFEASQSIQSKLDYSQMDDDSPLRMLYNTTDQSNVCKRCIDNVDLKGKKRQKDQPKHLWCPTANYQSGYCCTELENCPKPGGICSDSFELSEFKYMLCPNEIGCLFSRTLSPPNNEAEKLYENLQGRFQKGDLCSFKITIPSGADINDMMYLRIEYLNNAKASLIKGKSLLKPDSLYQITPGHDFSAQKGTDLYLLFESLSISSGDFVFKVWYKKVEGRGRSQPRVVDYPPGWIDPSSPEYEASLNRASTSNTTADATQANATDTGANSTDTNTTSDGNSTASTNSTETPASNRNQATQNETNFVENQASANENYDPFNLDRFGDEEVFGSNKIEEVLVSDVTPEEEPEGEDSGGMSTAGAVFLWLFILLIVLPCLLVLVAFLIARFKPESEVGQKVKLRYQLFKQMVEQRIAEQKQRAEERRQRKELEKFEKEQLAKSQAEQEKTGYGQVQDMDDISFAKQLMAKKRRESIKSKSIEPQDHVQVPTGAGISMSSFQTAHGEAVLPHSAPTATPAPANPTLDYVKQMQEMQNQMMTQMKGQMTPEAMEFMMKQQQMMMQTALMQQQMGQDQPTAGGLPRIGTSLGTTMDNASKQTLGFGEVNIKADLERPSDTPLGEGLAKPKKVKKIKKKKKPAALATAENNQSKFELPLDLPVIQAPEPAKAFEDKPSESAPLGNLAGPLGGLDGGIDDDSDFNYDDVQIQGAGKQPMRQSQTSDFF